MLQFVAYAFEICWIAILYTTGHYNDWYDTIATLWAFGYQTWVGEPKGLQGKEGGNYFRTFYCKLIFFGGGGGHKHN